MATIPNIELVQSTSGSVSLSNSITITPSSSLTSGNACFISVTNFSSGVEETASISGGGTWVKVTSQIQGSICTDLWYLANATGGTSSITVTLSASLNYAWAFAEFSGIIASSPLDIDASNGGTYSSGGTLTATTSSSVAQEVELCIYATAGTGSSGASGGVPSGYTQAQSLGIGAGANGSFGYLVRTGSVSTQSATSTIGSPTTTAVMILGCFKAVSNVIQLRQAAAGASASSVTSSAVTITAPRPGNFQVLIVSRESTTNGQTSGITQSNASWIKAFEENASATSTNEIWYSTNASASAGTTVTANFSATQAAANCTYLEFYGMGTTPTVDQTVGNQGTSTSMTSGTTGATTSTPELAIAGFALVGGLGASASSVINGYQTGSTTNTGSGSIGAWALYSVLVPEATTSTGVSTGSGGSIYGTWASALATFTTNYVPSISVLESLMLMGVGSF